MGYLWDSASAELRPIVGTPGAAYLGPALGNFTGYTNATSCAAKPLALLTGSGGDIYAASLPSGTAVRLAPQLAAKQQIALSPVCSAGLVYSVGSNQVLLVQGLTATPAVKTLALPGSNRIVGATVADSGAILIAASQPGGGIQISAIRSDGTQVASLATVVTFGGMAFLPNADRALIADSRKSTVWLQNSLDPATPPVVLATAADGVAQPLAVAASADAQSAVVLSAGSQLLQLDLSKKTAPQKMTCKCAASELVPLAGNMVFRLNESGSGPVWAFASDPAGSRMVFIPAALHVAATGATR